ncbi:MAG: hypothetical protein AB7G75_28500 [Candidatus Binatia bacterium]
MQASRFVKFLRTIALAAALAIPTVAIYAQPATALPRDCGIYLRQYKSDLNLAKAWNSYAQTMLSLGYYDEAQQASYWAEAYYGLAQDAIGQYAACL